jgi:hypothetical protein
MADQEIIKHVKKAITVSRDHSKKWQHKLLEILLEIGIIVFAVSLSIWLHNWSESLKDRDEEREFLTGLKQDLQADIKEMKSDLKDFQNVLEGSNYLRRVGSGEAPSLDSVKIYGNIFGNYTQINPRISRFEALKGSGKMNIIRDKALLIHITDLYTKDFPLIVLRNNYINNLRQTQILPLLEQHLQLNAQEKPTNWLEVFRLSQMRFMLVTLQAAQNNIEAYTIGIGKCELIISEIDKELK